MKKKKIAITIAVVVALVVLLTPIRVALKDGGSVRYQSLVYQVTKIHEFVDDGTRAYVDGLEVQIFGVTVYRETDE